LIQLTSTRSTVITGQTEGLKGGFKEWVDGGMGGMGGFKEWVDVWAVCEVWVDRWADSLI
jgi:hypothetical protein